MIVNVVIVIVGALIGAAVSRTLLRKKRGKGKSLPAVAQSQPVPPVTPPVTKLPEIAEDNSTLAQKMWLEEENKFVFKLNEDLGASRDELAVAKVLADGLLGFLGVETVAVFLFKPESGRVVLEWASGRGQAEVGAYSFKSGESITGIVAATRQPVMVNDLSLDSYYLPLNQEEYLRNAFISAPIMSRGEFIGVVNAANKRSGAFREHDVRCLMNAARVGAIAFKNCSLLAQIQKDSLNTITTLAMLIDARDAYTKRHSENVTRYAVAVAEEMKLPKADVETIRRAGLLHDIGKVAIRDSVLLKEGKLTDEEFEVIKTHAERGAKIVAALPFLSRESALVRHHHEKYDGRGYPDRLAGEQIELGARILCVADSFDAMTTDRPYRKAMTTEDANKELERCKSTQFDPDIVAHFSAVITENPGLRTS